jgi:hypothetical protein
MVVSLRLYISRRENGEGRGSSELYRETSCEASYVVVTSAEASRCSARFLQAPPYVMLKRS